MFNGLNSKGYQPIPDTDEFMSKLKLIKQAKLNKIQVLDRYATTIAKMSKNQQNYILDLCNRAMSLPIPARDEVLSILEQDLIEYSKTGEGNE